MLGIDRQNLGAGCRRVPHEQRARADQALLIGERNRRTTSGRRERRLEAGGAGDRGHDPVRRSLRCLHHGGGTGPCFDAGAGKSFLQVGIGIGIADGGKAHAKLAGETGKRRAIAVGSDCLDFIMRSISPQQIDCTAADRARRAQQRHAARRGRHCDLGSNFGQWLCRCHRAYHTRRPWAGAAVPWRSIPIRSAAAAATRKPSSRSIKPP